MKMLKKLGQTATEYLIILAVVIVIALIVVGVMGGIPGVGKGGKRGVADAYWSTSPVGITQAGISASGAETMVLKNNQNDAITVTSVMFGPNMMLPASRVLAAGESANIAVGDVINSTECPAGNSFSYNVEINYTVQSTGASYTMQGQKYEGTCAN